MSQASKNGVILMRDRQVFPGTVIRIWDKFVHYKLPQPIPSMEIYRCSYTDIEWAALRVLREKMTFRVLREKNADVMFTGGRFCLFYVGKDREEMQGGPRIEFSFPDGILMPDTRMVITDLPVRMQEILRPWITSVNWYRYLRKELNERLNGIMGNANAGYVRRQKHLDPCVNTPGQLQRIWPELQPFFESNWKDVVRQSSVRSRLPRRLGYSPPAPYNDKDWVTPEQFRCEHYDCPEGDRTRWNSINEVLQLMALAKDIPPIQGYPDFYGS